MEMTKMEMKLDRHLLRKWRETRAWSQEHLAALAGLSLRTIQRIEADGRASAEHAWRWRRHLTLTWRR